MGFELNPAEWWEFELQQQELQQIAEEQEGDSPEPLVNVSYYSSQEF
jgi:hypothetical protein